MITSTIPTATITGNFVPMNSFLKAALYYAEVMNWLVFPLKPQSKIPLTQHGFKDATRNTDQIIQWWTQYPDANIAIVTGAQSGLFALDVDPRNGGNEDFDQLNNELGINLLFLDTPQSLTGSGGFHLFFQYPTTQVIRSGKLSAGIDIKGDGGYVVAPHSIHPNGKAYVWEGESDPQDGITLAQAPAKLLSLLVGKVASTGSTVPMYRNQWVDPKQIQELQSALMHISANDYHDWVKVGLCLHSLGNDDAGFRLWDEWSQTSEKYDAKVQGQKWRSFEVRRDLNRETIFWMAQQAGWTSPADPSAALHSGNLLKALGVSLQPSEASNEPPAEKIKEPAILDAFDIEAVDEFNYSIEPIGILKPICDFINATAPVPQPVLALNSALCLVGALLGRKVQSSTGLRTNLYINSLAQSGTGKGHAPKIISKILRDTGRSNILGGSKIASGAALFNRAASQPNTLFQLDEFGKVLGGITGKMGAVPEYKRSIIDNLLELYNRADEVITGTEYADQSIARKDIEYPCISVYAITTLETYFEAIDARSIEDGLLNRFVTCPLPLLDQDPVFNEDAFIPDDIPAEIVQYIEQIEKKIEGYGNIQRFTGSKPQRILNSPDAELLFRAFREQVAEKRLALKGTGFDLLWKRAPENAIKIAMIVAVGDLSLTIEDYHAAWAIHYIDFWMSRFIKIAQQRLSESQFHALEQDVYRLIRKAGKLGVTLRELTQYSRQFRAANGVQRMQVIGWLTTSKQIKEHPVTNRRKAYVPLAFDEV